MVLWYYVVQNVVMNFYLPNLGEVFIIVIIVGRSYQMIKFMFGLSVVYSCVIASFVGYYTYTKQVDLAVLGSLLLGAGVLNCGNIYGFMVNENLAKKWEVMNG